MKGFLPPAILRRCCARALTTLATLSFHTASADVLKIDINDRENDTAALTASGFDAFTIDSVGGVTAAQTGSITRTFGAISVTVSRTGASSYDDRMRTTPGNLASFTESALLRDFLFCTTTNTTDGFHVDVAGLLPNTAYPVSVWSFDTTSTGNRVSDWSANGVIVRENYVCNGSALPADNSTYRIDFRATSDATGLIRITGVRDVAAVGATGANSPGVFLNALRVGDPIIDTEPDGMGDVWESTHGLQVGVNDSAGDLDGDGLLNRAEFDADTLPDVKDTDFDTIFDGKETMTGIWNGPNDTGTNPLKADSDQDGLSDGLENPDLPYADRNQPGSDPNNPDSDGDSFSDGDELMLLTNPDDGAQHPANTGTLAIDFGEDDAALAPPIPPVLPTAALTNWFGLDGTTGWTNTFITPAYPAGITVAVTPVGSVTLDDRDRGPLNGGNTYLDLYRDFLFANLSGDQGDGMDVTITGLRPDTTYPIILIIFDRFSSGRSQWLANDAGGDFVFKKGDTFAGATDPLATSLAEHSVRFLFTTDSTGRIVIEGLAATDATATHNVFLNGFLIREPVQPIDLTAVSRNPVTGSMTLTWTSVPNAPYMVQFSSSLEAWITAGPAVYGNGPAGTLTTTTTIPIPSSVSARGFLRVRRADF